VLLIMLGVFFALGIYMVVDKAVAFPASVSASRGHGQPGMAVATVVDCDEDGCVKQGDYTSDDGTITYRNIGLHGRGWREGKLVAALYEGRSLTGPLVFPADDHHAWILEILGLGRVGHGVPVSAGHGRRWRGGRVVHR
jgi:hypothetical protein